MNAKQIPVVLGALALCAAFCVLTLWLTGRTATDPAATERLAKLAALNARDKQRLESYEWIDRDNGVVRIPIRRAMEIVIPQLNAVHPPTPPIK